MRGARDESGIIINWLVKVGVFLAVLGVIGFDAGSIVVNTVTLSSSAEDVAIAVSLKVDSSTTFSTFSDIQVYNMAVDEVNDESSGVAGAKVLRKGTEIDEEGVVQVRLRRRANTLIAKYIGPLKKYTVGTGTGQAGSRN